MADDANFVGGRLRLAAFLRTVEDDVPQRPSRFKRRLSSKHFVREPDSAEIPCIGDDVLPDVSEQDRSRGAAGGVSAEEAPIPGTEFDLPRSGAADVVAGKHDGSDSACAKRQYSSAKTEKRTKNTKQVARVAKLKKQSSVLHKSSDTRKRRLPVNGLALLRTTTSDGLPEPGV
jgi:hypothetical protein